MRLCRYGVVVAVVALLVGAGGVASAETVAGGTAGVPPGGGTGVTIANATVDDATGSTLTIGYRVGPTTDLRDAEIRVYGPNHHRYYDLSERSGTVDVTVAADSLAGGVHRFRAAVVNASPPHDPALATDTAVVEARSPVSLVSSSVDGDSVSEDGNVTVTATLRNPTAESVPYDVALYESGPAGPALHWNEHDSILGDQAVRRVVVPAETARTYALDAAVRGLDNGSTLQVNDDAPWTLVDGTVERARSDSDADGAAPTPGATEAMPNGTTPTPSGTESTGTVDRPSLAGGGGGSGGSVGGAADAVTPSADYDPVATVDGATVVVHEAPEGVRFGADLPDVSGAGVTVERAEFALAAAVSDVRVEFGTPTDAADVPPLDGADALAYLPVRPVGAADGTVARATLRVRANASALPAVAAGDGVVVYRYHDGEWSRLDARRTDDGAYEVEVTGLSTLAVGVDADAAGTADGAESTGTATPSSASTLDGSTAVGNESATGANGSSTPATPTSRTAATPSTSEGSTATTAPGFSVVAAAVALAGVALLARRGSRER